VGGELARTATASVKGSHLSLYPLASVSQRQDAGSGSGFVEND